MAPKNDSAGSVRPRSRRSIAHVPRSKAQLRPEQDNSTTDVGAIKSQEANTKLAGKDKKSRSKSLGPGGLDALQTSNGNRRKSTAPFPLKSILKPSVPVSPVRNIPSFEETRKTTPARDAPQRQLATSDGAGDQDKEELLIDFETPTQPSHAGAHHHANPFDTFNASSAIRDGMAAAKEQEEKEKREHDRKKVLEQREARRKSLANRRVSFAPEATLHTWNVVEIPEDSTSSSSSNSTRRASSAQNTEHQEPAQEPAQEPPSSPSNGADSDADFSPVPQTALQHLRERSAPLGYENSGGSQDLPSSSPFSGSSTEGSEDSGSQSVVRDDDDDVDDVDRSSDSDAVTDAESTAMSVDDATVQSAATAQPDNDNTTSSARLNEALRQAAREAGTRSIEHEGSEDGDASMEIAEQEITGAFQPWIKKGQRQSFDWDDISARNQVDVDPAKPIVEEPAPTYSDGDDDNENLSMDMTNAIGGILSKGSGNRQGDDRRKSSGEETTYDEQTMELTNIVGGIKQQASPAKSAGGDSNENEDEGMTMEFTSVVGGLVGKSTTPPGDPKYPALPPVTDEDRDYQAQTPTKEDNNGTISEPVDRQDDMEDVDMEFTGAVGGIIPKPQDQVPGQEDDDQTTGMEMTTAVGGIMPLDSGTLNSNQTEAAEVEPEPQLGSTLVEDAQEVPAKSPISFHLAAVASENGSPSLASVRSRRARRSSTRASSTSSSVSRHTSPVQKPSTPKQLTPQVTSRPVHNNTPLSNTPLGSSSGPKLSQPNPEESASKRDSVDRERSRQIDTTPRDLTPLSSRQPGKRRSSGLGIDKEGLGSPTVAAILDKRRSIGDETPQFVPRSQGVRFEDPVKLHAEVDHEREEEEKREDGHIPPEKDATSSLKDMISSLTPKKNKLRGRKSLHVGTAKGLLGKRPAELDMDDEELDSTPKRLRGPGVSPVKTVKLPPPLANDQTVARSVQSPAPKSLVFSPGKLNINMTPVKDMRSPSKDSTSPLKHGIESLHVTTPTAATPTQPEEAEDASAQKPEPNYEPIHLQDFLNMTNIHFMELTTTKRRHTTAPGSPNKIKRLSGGDGPKQGAASFEDCVAAGFCTLPMLELYQHSCRELKSYISEGRQVIRTIELETHADNPPLFREYVNAPPDIRLFMDNQFRSVKTHARLLSKGTWYEWRMKLLEGLKEGLNRHVEEMKGDDEFLTKREAELNNAVPGLVERNSSLKDEATSLQQLTDEMENCDQNELRGAREKLSGVESELEVKKRQLQEMQADIQDKTDTINTATELKEEFTAQIREAERVKEECRGWDAREINELKSSVVNLERQTGWSIVSASFMPESSAGPLLTMRFRDQLRLSFYPGAFCMPGTTDGKQNMPLSLVYSPGDNQKFTDASNPHLSPISSLVLKSLQNHVATIQQATIAPKELLRFVSETWDRVLDLEEEARMLQYCGVTRLDITEENDGNGNKPYLRARCTLLSRKSPGAQTTSTKRRKSFAASEKRKRVDVDFVIRTRIESSGPGGTIGTMGFETDVTATKVYGFGPGADESGLSEGQMRDVLCKELGLSSEEEKGVSQQLGEGAWWKAVQALDGIVF